MIRRPNFTAAILPDRIHARIVQGLRLSFDAVCGIEYTSSSNFSFSYASPLASVNTSLLHTHACECVLLEATGILLDSWVFVNHRKPQDNGPHVDRNPNI
jgi:hypothetical protein